MQTNCYDIQVGRYLLYDSLGTFTNALYRSIFHADRENFEKLRKGFPNEVEAVEKYRNA